jgi:hypothetical protein
MTTILMLTSISIAGSARCSWSSLFSGGRRVGSGRTEGVCGGRTVRGEGRKYCILYCVLTRGETRELELRSGAGRYATRIPWPLLRRGFGPAVVL